MPAVEEVTGVHVSEATICCVLRRNGLTRKNIRLVAAQRSMEYQHCMATVLSFARALFVYVDETGIVMLIITYGSLVTLYVVCVQKVAVF